MQPMAMGLLDWPTNSRSFYSKFVYTVFLLQKDFLYEIEKNLFWLLLTISSLKIWIIISNFTSASPSSVCLSHFTIFPFLQLQHKMWLIKVAWHAIRVKTCIFGHPATPEAHKARQNWATITIIGKVKQSYVYKNFPLCFITSPVLVTSSCVC